MENNVHVSILIPVRNERNYIEQCLESVFNQQDISKKFEVIIADGMSTDGTREVIKHYQEKFPFLIMIDNPGKIVPIGMNTAIKKAAGNFLIRIDGHCIIAPDYVKNCVTHLINGEADGVGGPMETIGETPLAQTIAIAMSSPFGVGNSAFRTTTVKSVIADTVPFPAYTRSIIRKAGLYDEELVRNQDDEYNYRVRSLGGKLLLADDVRSQYYSRASIKKLWKQYFQYGYYKVRVLQKHPRQMSIRQFVPPLFVLSLLVSMTFGLVTDYGWILFGVILITYLFANLTASLLTAAKKGWKHFIALPMAFTAIHISYGIGFLIGLVKYWNRWRDRTGRVPSWDME